MYSETPEARDPFSKAPEHVEEVLERTEAFEGSEDDFKDHLFHEYAKQALVEDFASSLGDYLEPEDVDTFLGVLMSHSDEEIISVLSLPKELRERWFDSVERSVSSGTPVEEVAEEVTNKFAKAGFGIGFHTSPNDIKPNPETGAWFIKGTEADHRDDDLVRAYYSSQYRHLYKKQNSKYIYVVRTDPDYKTDKNWSRASNLSVVMRIPLHSTINFVESTVRNRKTPDA